MATLNVKGLPDALYRKLAARADRNRRSIAQEVTLLLTEALAAHDQPSILDLIGVGEAAWAGTHAGEYVAAERGSWSERGP